MQDVTLKRGELLNLHGAIHGIGPTVSERRFGYALGRTRRSILDEVEATQDGRAAHARKRRDIAERHALKENNQPVVEKDGSYRIDPAQRRAFVDAIEAHEKEERDFLAETVTVKVHQIGWDETPRQMANAHSDGLWPMLTGEPPADAK